MTSLSPVLPVGVLTHPRRIEWASMVPFVAIHLLPIGALWTGITWAAAAWCIVAYAVIMFAITAGYHRYFSHRTFKTGRVVQFIFAFVAQCSAQKGALWWAASHRQHHRASDQPDDVHSPRQDGMLYAHWLWIFNHTSATDFAAIQDMAKYPELRFLNRFDLLPPALLAIAATAALGLPGLFIGFGLSTVALWHVTFCVNSVAHRFGKQPFATGDDSRNLPWLAMLTLGEGWHNNHHYYQGCARQGFLWWQVDMTYWVLRALQRVGVVWDMREPPARVIMAARQLS